MYRAEVAACSQVSFLKSTLLKSHKVPISQVYQKNIIYRPPPLPLTSRKAEHGAHQPVSPKSMVEVKLLIKVVKLMCVIWFFLRKYLPV